jgi:tetratricopeptide (TPR) repeat protein
MSEPQRTEPADPGPLSEADRVQRIEELLLSGLDSYFGGNYEQAINIWTRVAFLERGHGRARAYIDRARGALAERQRESEELLHNGVAAYQAGNLQSARELLTRAIESGGTNETALLFLERLGRLDGSTRPSRQVPPSPRFGSSRDATGRSSAAPTRWFATVVASGVVAAVILLGALGAAAWLRQWPVATPASDPAPAEPLPIVRGSDARIARARQLLDAGRPAEALRELDAMHAGDAGQGEGDQLRSAIQRALLSTVKPAAAEAGEGVR